MIFIGTCFKFINPLSIQTLSRTSCISSMYIFSSGKDELNAKHKTKFVANKFRKKKMFDNEALMKICADLGFSCL